MPGIRDFLSGLMLIAIGTLVAVLRWNGGWIAIGAIALAVIGAFQSLVGLLRMLIAPQRSEQAESPEAAEVDLAAALKCLFVFVSKSGASSRRIRAMRFFARERLNYEFDDREIESGIKKFGNADYVGRRTVQFETDEDHVSEDGARTAITAATFLACLDGHIEKETVAQLSALSDRLRVRPEDRTACVEDARQLVALFNASDMI